MSTEQLLAHTQQLLDMIPTPLGEYSKDTLQNTYETTISCLKAHNRRYYQDNDPIISDYRYDELFAYLQEIETFLTKNYPDLLRDDSPTQGLQAQLDVQSSFDKATHKVPMLSLANSYDEQDVLAFDERVQRILQKVSKDAFQETSTTPQNNETQEITYLVEPKFDGVRIDLLYRYGKFHQAITRGDGMIGEDVTANIATIDDQRIPKQLQDKGWHEYERVYFGGEIVMTKTDFARLNAQREKEGESIYANTRNLTAGSIKQLDPNITRERKLRCYVYEYALPHESKVRYTMDFTRLGFQVLRIGDNTTYTIQETIKLCTDQTKQTLDAEDIDFDGLVIKVADNTKRSLIGSTDHHPRWAIAYKFPTQQVEAHITDVVFQVGRTGVITPVASLEPVKVGGVIVQRVSLHNFAFIENKDIHLHDRVRLQRSGEVIPYIVSVIHARRPHDATPIVPPRHCPVCATSLIQEEDFRYCVNTDCPAQLRERIKHFVSKNAMNIDGIGERIIELFIQKKILTKLTDIYRLDQEEIVEEMKQFEGFGEKKLENIKNALSQSKHHPLWRVLNAIGIPHIGKKMSKVLDRAISAQQNGQGQTTLSPERLRQYLSDQNFLLDIEGIGEKTAAEMPVFVQENAKMFEELSEYGVAFVIETTPHHEGPLAGVRFCLTGSLGPSRDEVVQICEEQGMVFDANITKDTEVLLVGDRPGSKLAKAQQKNITLLTQQALLQDTDPQRDFLRSLLQKQSTSTSNGDQGLFGE